MEDTTIENVEDLEGLTNMELKRLATTLAEKIPKTPGWIKDRIKQGMKLYGHAPAHRNTYKEAMKKERLRREVYNKTHIHTKMSLKTKEIRRYVRNNSDTD